MWVVAFFLKANDCIEITSRRHVTVDIENRLDPREYILYCNVGRVSVVFAVLKIFPENASLPKAVCTFALCFMYRNFISIFEK